MGTVIKFSKPYKFEDEEYTGIDLAPLDDLTGKDLLKAEKVYFMSGGAPGIIELTMSYAFILASIGTGKPISFFEKLPLRDATAVKAYVMGFFGDMG